MCVHYFFILASKISFLTRLWAKPKKILAELNNFFLKQLNNSNFNKHMANFLYFLSSGGVHVAPDGNAPRNKPF